jgi:hypothetical protein
VSDIADVPANAPVRIVARPHASMWSPVEILSLAEAACLYWPHGPLTTKSLRTAARDGSLAVTWIAGKVFTSPQAIAEMTKPSRSGRPRDWRAARSDSAGEPPLRSETGQALMRRVAEEKARLKPKLNRRDGARGKPQRGDNPRDACE